MVVVEAGAVLLVVEVDLEVEAEVELEVSFCLRWHVFVSDS